MLAMLLAGCAALEPELNEPIPQGERAAVPLGPFGRDGYYPTALDTHGASDELLLALAFSGGGKRSSSFSYGALQGLRDLTFTVDGVTRRLLDEIDTINSVSGGSFTAAYYGLNRDRIFTDYETDFLRRDVDGEIVEVLLAPWEWQWLVNPYYGTNDAMAERYDAWMFDGATYADLQANGRPMVSINATDVTNGSVFSFSQLTFDLLCSDLSEFPLARAVAASNGFPILFTPITLENHADDCAAGRPRWVQAAMEGSDPFSRPARLAALAARYFDTERVQYVHLLDGGIADNLAMRGALNTLFLVGLGDRLIEAMNFDRLRRIIVIAVDGQTGLDEQWAQQRSVSGIGQILGLVSGTQIDQYNFETLHLARRQLEVLTDAVRTYRCARGPMIYGHPCDDVDAHLLHINLQQIPDSGVRDYLQRIPTGLTLRDEAIDFLIQYGRALILARPELREAMAALEDPPQ
jgi:NTE family protein